MAGSGASTQHGGYLMCRCISLPRGSPDMTCPPTSPRIEDANSHQPSGVSSVRGGGDTYHHHSLSPQSNGMGERAHRKIKDALCTCLAGAEWPLHLPWVLLGLRAAPKEDSVVSSSELVYGTALILWPVPCPNITVSC
jgi:hypothetical protein